ncbi:YlcI/YnfO family protein [Proteus terrae]|uniref:YlcI/YnfO family protein n=1 Tax=Proteus terrae TaxID=1574161 RepID=UPI001BAD1428|nr:YlcI/YnfO family protein [Proteus terrae]
MATSSTNNKSQQLNARFPHEVVADLEKNLEDGESKAQFIVTAVKTEIKRRQRKAKQSNE